jgi:superfamily II DNA helicase RecQ
MPFKFFVVPLDDGGAAEDELNRFLAGHAVVTTRVTAAKSNGSSVWAVAVQYRGLKAAKDGADAPKVDYMKVLAPEAFELFSRLRAYRKAAAEVDNVPVYAVFSNEQLAEIAKRRPTTKDALGTIDGIGPKKLERHAVAILKIVGAAAEGVTEKVKA